MNKYRLNIDGKEVYGLPGQTILDVCKENDIFIPTLCYDERTEIYRVLLNQEKQTWSFFFPTIRVTAVRHVCLHVLQVQTVRAM